MTRSIAEFPPFAGQAIRLRVASFIAAGQLLKSDSLAEATPTSAPSTLERVYVDGAQSAIGRNGDGLLGPANLNNANSNVDQWYYFLPNRLGSVTALLATDAPNQTLECYR